MKKHLLVMMCLLFSAFSALAQTIDIAGVVKDDAGEPVIGATVIVKGTSNAIYTDEHGKFELKKVSPTATLTVQYLGATPMEIEVGGRQHIPITLSAGSTAIDAVVATGYGGKQLRSKVTNSISKVDNEVLENGVYNNPAQALSGAVSGLKVSTTTGSVGSTPTITLRGGTNLDGSGSPLIIIDGQLRSGLNDINPDDIESIEVLKDAGATALYGARASNGVILVTTKTGKAGSGNVNVKARVGVGFDRPLHEFLGAEDYIYYMRNAYVNSSHASGVVNNINTANPMGTGNDVINNPNALWNLMFLNVENKHLLEKGWQTMVDPVTGRDLIFKEDSAYDYNIVNPTITQDYNISASGGSDRGSYYAGLGYHNAKGQAINTFYERFSATFNNSYKINNWLESISNFSYNRANWQGIVTGESESNYYARALSIPPTLRWQDEDGNMLLGANFKDGNQLYQSDAFRRFNQTDKFTMIQSFKVDFNKYLSLKGTANWYYSEGFYESFNEDYWMNPTTLVSTRSSWNQFSRDFSQTYNAILSYDRTFNHKHTVSALTGYEYYYDQNYGFSASGSGAPTDDFQDLGYTDPGEGMRSIDSWHSKYAIASWLGRVNYDYDGKYLLSGVFRYDGYSSLLGDNRWGFFPGVSAGWVFGKESFVADAIPAMSFGKLRASFGMNGNASSIGRYTLQGSYGSAKYDGNVGYLIGTLPNPSLQWEKTRTFEGGIDVSFFQNRLNANITVYNRLTYDKHASFSLPTTTGFSSITNNNGSFMNTGVELELSGTIIQNKDWNWKMGGNISYNKNKVVELPNNGLENNRQGGQQIYTGNGNELQWVGGYQEGQEPGVLVGYVFDGIFKTEDDLNQNYSMMVANGFGNYQYTPGAYANLTDAEKSKAYLLELGDVKYKDINGDGKIDQYDQVVIGNTIPRYFGGLNTTVSWKGLSLYVRADFAFDYWLYDATTPWIMDCAQGTYNTITAIKDAWSPENPDSNMPRYTWASFLGPGNYSHTRTSTMFAYRGDYLALREVSLTYNLPRNTVQKLACKNIQVSVSGQNLGYLTAAKHVATPEVGGYVYSANPVPRTLILGLNVTF